MEITWDRRHVLINEKYTKKITIFFISFVLLFTTLLYSLKADNYSSVITSNNSDYVSKILKKDEVIEIDIIADEQKWEDMIENASKEEYISADVVINGEKISTVGIRPKGNSSLNMVASDETTDRFSFKIDFDQYIDGQNLYGLKKLALNNMIGDASYMKEYLSYDLISEIGVNTPAYSFANITLNGQPWGLYLAVEVLEEDFLSRYYGSDYGNLYKPENTMGGMEKPDGMQAPPEGQAPPDGQTPPNEQAIPDANSSATEKEPFTKTPMTSKSSNGTNLVYNGDELKNYSGIFDNVVTKSTTEKDFTKVVEMIKALDKGEDLEKYLNVDEILRYFAANTFLVNLDHYAGTMKHNYYLYENDGTFEILPWDYNLSFGAFQHGSASEIINFPIDKPFTDSAENTPLIAKLLEVDEYKEIYHKYLLEIVQNHIQDGKFENKINSLDKLISEYVINDKTAFFNYAQYKEAVENLKIYGNDRAQSILLQLNGSQPSETYGNLETKLDTKALGSMGGDKKGGDFKKGDKRPEAPPNMENGNRNAPPDIKNVTSVEPKDLIIPAISILSLIIATIIIYKFRRKKFNSN